MNADIERSSDKKYFCPVWVGSVEDLRKLAGAVERMAESRGRTLLADFDSQSERMIKEIDEGDDEPDVMEMRKGRLKENRDSERGRIVNRLEVTATVVDGDDTTRGPITDVLAELDRRTVKSVRFSMTVSLDDSIEVRLDRDGGYGSESYGAKLLVSSTDRGWANQVHAQVSEEIDKGKPWYSWIRRAWARLIVGGGTAVAFALTVVLLILPAFSSKVFVIAWFIGLGIVWLAGTVLIMAEWPYKWLVPRFEVTGEDGTSKASRRVASLIAPLLSLIIGVIVNRITS